MRLAKPLCCSDLADQSVAFKRKQVSPHRIVGKIHLLGDLVDCLSRFAKKQNYLSAGALEETRV